MSGAARWAPWTAWGVVVVAAGGIAVSSRLASAPKALCTAGAIPEQASRAGDAWYWIERPRGRAAALVACSGGQTRRIAEAPAIGSYAAGPGAVAWTAREGEGWAVWAADADGSAKVRLSAPKEEPKGVRVLGDRVVWLSSRPGYLAEETPFVPLGPSVQVLAAPRSGGPVARLAGLPEAVAGEVVGETGGEAVVTALRPGNPGSTIFYAVPLDGRPPHRLAGQVGRARGIVLPGSGLHWTAPSDEAGVGVSAWRLRRPAKDGSAQNLAEWLPSGSQPHESGGRVYFTTEGTEYGVWASPDRHDVAQVVPLPPRFTGVAVGSGKMLLRGLDPVRGGVQLYEEALP
ncbi:MAG: hypothetical protein NT029_08980 [Armatimonadetes bacterium]|nr:hypothetical protein [Armatimonadota bacterium]